MQLRSRHAVDYIIALQRAVSFFVKRYLQLGLHDLAYSLINYIAGSAPLHLLLCHIQNGRTGSAVVIIRVVRYLKIRLLRAAPCIHIRTRLTAVIVGIPCSAQLPVAVGKYLPCRFLNRLYAPLPRCGIALIYLIGGGISYIVGQGRGTALAQIVGICTRRNGLRLYRLKRRALSYLAHNNAHKICFHIHIVNSQQIAAGLRKYHIPQIIAKSVPVGLYFKPFITRISLVQPEIAVAAAAYLLALLIQHRRAPLNFHGADYTLFKCLAVIRGIGALRRKSQRFYRAYGGNFNSQYAFILGLSSYRSHGCAQCRKQQHYSQHCRNF